MEFEKVIKSRHSIRAFQRREVEKEKIKQILELTNLAPSAGNLQAYKIFLVKEQRKKEALADAALGQEFIAEAPVALVFCADPARSASRYGSRGRNLYSIQDATIACSFAMLAATSLGLGSCWVGAFDDEEVKKVLGVRDLVPVAILPIGYPAEEPYITGRRSLEELVQEI